jgi:hypothetical protein
VFDASSFHAKNQKPFRGLVLCILTAEHKNSAWFGVVKASAKCRFDCLQVFEHGILHEWRTVFSANLSPSEDLASPVIFGTAQGN